MDVLYLTPIFRANTTHKYDTVDYLQIDPDFGTEEDLRELIGNAHEAGMYVVLDAVFNHTSRDFFAFRDLLQSRKNPRIKTGIMWMIFLPEGILCPPIGPSAISAVCPS